MSILIERNGERLTKRFKREKVTVKSIPYYGLLENKVGYIKLTSFTKIAPTKLVLVDLKSQEHLNGIILDLRSNPGAFK